MKSFKLRAVTLALCILPAAALAEITATVTPGYQFATGERPTTANLNLLGTPTIAITGTLGGTNVALGANTVSGTMLMDSVAGSNLTWNGSSPRGLVISDEGVNVDQISSGIAGDGLSGGSGDALAVNVDGETIQTTNDVLTLQTNINPGYIAAVTNSVIGSDDSGTNVQLTLLPFMLATNGTLTLNTFVSPEMELGDGQDIVITNMAHNLGVMPVFERWVIVCVTNENGYVAGDEVDVCGLYDSGGSRPAYCFGANATNVWIIQSHNPAFNKISTGASVSVTRSNWRLKCYARP